MLCDVYSQWRVWVLCVDTKDLFKESDTLHLKKKKGKKKNFYLEDFYFLLVSYIT